MAADIRALLMNFLINLVEEKYVLGFDFNLQPSTFLGKDAEEKTKLKEE